MLFTLFTNPFSFFIWLFALLIAVTVHEFAHAWTADRLGDPTPRSNGRLTLNPLAHLDPIGTLMLILTRFGWGKPVLIDPYNLENPRRDTALISLAGPASNLILAFLLSLLKWPIFYPIIFLNIALAVFNLLPIPPLDGSKILLGFLPKKLAFQLEEILEQYSIILLVLLLLPFSGQSLASKIIAPIIYFILDLLLGKI